MLAALLLAVPAAPATAADVSWESSYDAAFERARQEETVVFLAVNMDGEPANERMTAIYAEPSIAELSSRTVNLVASLFDHGSGDRPCKRFGAVTCMQHREVEAAARSVFEKDGKGHAIAPQHVFFGPDGKVLLSVSWEMTRSELEWCFVTALRELDPDSDVAMPAGARVPRRLVMGGVRRDAEEALQPLSGKELEETIQKLRGGFGALEGMDAFHRLLVTDHEESIEYVGHELDRGYLSLTDLLRTDTLRKIARYSPPSFWEAVSPLLEAKESSVRSMAAVTLEQLGAPRSTKVLERALSREDSEYVRKNLLRALGTAGAEDRGARRTLLKHARDDDALLRRNALLALGWHVGDEDVGEALLAALGSADPLDRRAAALALALGRHTAHRDMLARAAEEEPDAAQAGALRRALAVLDGANLDVIAADVREVGEDEQPRERFFGWRPPR